MSGAHDSKGEAGSASSPPPGDPRHVTPFQAFYRERRSYIPLDAFRYTDTGEVYVYLNEPGHRLPERFVPASEADELRNALRCIRAYCPNQPTSHVADDAFSRIIWVCKAALDPSPSSPEALKGEQG